jgi:hypothetical protein
MSLMSLMFRITIELVVCHVGLLALGTKRRLGRALCFRTELAFV